MDPWTDPICMSLAPEHGPGSTLGRDLSPQAQACALWLRHAARAVKSARLYKRDNPVVEQLREQLWEQLSKHLKEHGGWRLRITSSELKLNDEVVVRGSLRKPGQEEHVGGPEEKLPFMFYSDGIRGLTLLATLQRREYDALFNALVQAGRGRNSQDDLMTLLWQANLGSILMETVPLEQTIFLSSRRPVASSEHRFRGQTFAWGASGTEIRADLGQMAGAQGLHRDTFDDWRLPDVHAQSTQAYQALLPQVDASRERVMKQWEEETAEAWTSRLPELLRRVLQLAPTDDTRLALCHAIVTWTVSALQRAAWEEAEGALKLLREVDPDYVYSQQELKESIDKLEGEEIAEQLDEAPAADQNRFAALAVAIGTPAIGLACLVMSLCQRQRPRAGAATALCYLCAEQPTLLEPWLADRRWYVVRNVVFILGQIGGAESAELLRIAAVHPDTRVRREVVKALGGVSRAERTPVLIQQLTARDPQLVSGALNMLSRERHPRVTKAIVDRIESKDFDTLGEDLQRAFMNALADVADDDTVPALEVMLTKNAGWFAMRTLARDFAARILCRVGTPRAMAVVEAGLRSRTEAIRQACMAAMAVNRNAA